MIVKLPQMNEREIKDLINKQNLCRIAFKGTEYPYMAPFQYTYFNDTLYFHFTDYGRKMKLLEKDNRVCVEIESYAPDLSQYNFVVLRGRLKVVEDAEERAKAIGNLAESIDRRRGEKEYFNEFSCSSRSQTRKRMVIICPGNTFGYHQTRRDCRYNRSKIP